VLAPFHAVFAPVHFAFGIGAADFLFQHRVWNAFEAVDGQAQGFADTHQRHRALDGARRVAAEHDLAAIAGGRVFGDVEEIFRAGFFIHRTEAKADAGGVDRDGDAAGFAG